MSASSMVAELVEEIRALDVPVTANAGEVGGLLSRGGTIAYVDLPRFVAYPVAGESGGLRLSMYVWAINGAADARGSGPLLDLVQLLAGALPARGELVPELFTMGDLQAPGYLLTTYRKGI